MIDVAKVLRDRLGAAAEKVSTQPLPRELTPKGILPLLGVDMNATSAKAIRLLGWKPRSREDAIVASAESLIRLGLV
jgi:dihydroflavonol-4-reductase